MIDVCEFSQFSCLLLNLLYFNVSAALTTPSSTVFHAYAQAEHSTSQIPLITSDGTFPVFIYLKIIHTLFLLSRILKSLQTTSLAQFLSQSLSLYS